MTTTPEELRAATPALSDGLAYLNTGAGGPSPRPVLDAVESALTRHEVTAPRETGFYEAAFDAYEESRAAVAAHLDTAPENVALTNSTADGVARVAAAVDDPDVVVRTDAEHPAVDLPFERLARVHGTELRTVPTEAGRIDREAYAAAVADADLVCFSSVTWTRGTRLPVRHLVETAHDAGARVLVDAVQSAGQEPLDPEAWGADAVVAAGHKWLLGVWGAGFLYVAPSFAEAVTPAHTGYRAVEDGYGPYEPYGDARRFEVGTTSPLPHAALAAAVETIESVGFETIRERVDRLTGRLRSRLPADCLRSPPNDTGLVAFDPPESVPGVASPRADPTAVVERLRREGVVVRDLPDGSLRASVHVFNTAADVDRLVTALGVANG